MTNDARKAEIIDEAFSLLGARHPNADVLIALSCAWDMGYRRAASLAEMARDLLQADGRAPDGT